jgi:hypothetical protein
MLPIPAAGRRMIGIVRKPEPERNARMDFAIWAVSTITQFLIALLCVIAIKSDFATRNFNALLAAFIVLSVIGMVASGLGWKRASDSSDKIARLTENTLYAIEGSPESHLQLHGIFQTNLGADPEKGIMTFQFYNESKYPMIDTSIWVSGHRNCKPEPDDYAVNIGDVYAGDGGDLTRLKLHLSKEKENEVHFSIKSRSVTLWEDFVVVWNGKAWVSDFALYKEIDGETHYIKKFRHDFPFKNKRIHPDVETQPK